MAAAGLPLALALGALAELAAGLVRFRDRRALAALTAPWTSVRRIAARPGPLDPLGALGGLAALLGAGVAGAAATGAVPGSPALVYLSLLLAAAGARLASDPADRLRAVLAEPAFLVALGVGFLRWDAPDIEAVRGAHAVLGTGFEVGPGAASAALALAAAALLAGGALRSPPDPGPGGQPWAVFSRWALSGATVLVVAALYAAADLGAGEPALLVWLGSAAGAASLLGAATGALELLPRAARWAPAGVSALAGGAALLVAVA